MTKELRNKERVERVKFYNTLLSELLENVKATATIDYDVEREQYIITMDNEYKDKHIVNVDKDAEIAEFTRKIVSIARNIDMGIWG